MKILISGGGVAGMTLAYWLREYGHEPIIIERGGHGHHGGYGFDFHGAGYELARRMRILPRLRERRLPVDAVVFVNGRGAVQARMPTAFLRYVLRGEYLGLMHGELEQALVETVRERAEIRHHQRITAVRQDDHGVEVTLADGARETADVLVGADGIHSHTRELVFGEEHRFARYLGYYVASHPVPDHPELGTQRVHYTEPGRQVVTYPTDRPGERIALYLFAAPDRGPVPRHERLDLLHRACGDMGWRTSRLLADAPPSAEIFVDTLTQIEMPHWHDGRVVLVGDACGAMTLASAQGVSLAMAGAYRLARALRAGDHRTAFARYQEHLRDAVLARQRAARRFARVLVPTTRAGLVTARTGMRLALREAFAVPLRRQLTSHTLVSQE